MIALGIYTLVLFIIGIMSAVVTYFMLLYRDPHDIVAAVLVIYYLLVITILVGTAISLNYANL